MWGQSPHLKGGGQLPPSSDSYLFYQYLLIRSRTSIFSPIRLQIMLVTSMLSMFFHCRADGSETNINIDVTNLSRILGEIFVHSFARVSSLLALSISSLPQFLRYQSVRTATGPTALCGIRTTARIEILSPEIQPSDPLVE